MRAKLVAITVIVLLTLVLSAAASSAQGPEPAAPQEAQAPLGTAFTYQGQLVVEGQPASGDYDFEFYLFNAASGGAQVSAPVAVSDLEVRNGLLTVQLDFGAAAFSGQARWLEIRVRQGNSGGFTILNPRQPLTPTPYALWSQRAPWSGLVGVPAAFADGVDNDTTYGAGTGLALAGGAFQLAGSYRLPQGCPAGQIARWDGSAWACAAANDHQHDAAAITSGTLANGRFSAYGDLQAEGRLDNSAAGDLLTQAQGDGRYWKLTGNGGTSSANFLGTTGASILTLKVNDTTALRLEPTSGAPNLVGGLEENSATGAVGATIGGGGEAGLANRVFDNYGTIGGGANNQAGDDDGDPAHADDATVAGGRDNQATADDATVAGGRGNQATADDATVGGGRDNTANGFGGTIGGGYFNTAGGFAGTVPGGRGNAAAGDYSFAAGRQAKANHDGAFVWADVIGGDFASTGIGQFLVRAAGGVGLGTNAPVAQLHVAEAVDGFATNIGNHVAVVENNATVTDDGPDVLALKVRNVADPDASVNYVTFFDSGGVIAAIDGNGSGGVAYKTSGSDLAEYLPVERSEHFAPGELVGLAGGVLSRRTTGAERLLVVSSAAGFVGNAPAGDQTDGLALAALLGQVPARVRGPVRAGDYILPSGRNDGTGVAAAPASLTPAQLGQVVGRALESSVHAEVKPVKLLVGLSQDQLWAASLQARDEQIAALAGEVAALRAERDGVEARLAALESSAPAGFRLSNGLMLLAGVALAGAWRLGQVHATRKRAQDQ